MVLLGFVPVDEVCEEVGCLEYDIVGCGCTGGGDMAQKDLGWDIFEDHVDAFRGLGHVSEDVEGLFLNVYRAFPEVSNGG